MRAARRRPRRWQCDGWTCGLLAVWPAAFAADHRWVEMRLLKRLRTYASPRASSERRHDGHGELAAVAGKRTDDDRQGAGERGPAPGGPDGEPPPRRARAVRRRLVRDRPRLLERDVAQRHAHLVGPPG